MQQVPINGNALEKEIEQEGGATESGCEPHRSSFSHQDSFTYHLGMILLAYYLFALVFSWSVALETWKLGRTARGALLSC